MLKRFANRAPSPFGHDHRQRMFHSRKARAMLTAARLHDRVGAVAMNPRPLSLAFG
jgi:hypothetical protein